MSESYSGYDSAIGAAYESTWGTFVSAAVWYNIISTDLRRVRPKQPRNTLGSRVARGVYVESDTVAGGFSVEGHYHDLAFLLEWAMGSSSTTGTTAPYTHAQTIAQPTASLSLDVVRGQGTSEKFEGVYAQSWSLALSAAGAPMVFSAQCLGQTAATRGSASTPSLSTTDAPILYNQVDADFTWNSVGYKLIDYNLSVDNAIANRLRFGSLNSLEQQPSGQASITTTVTLEVSDVLYAGLLADTRSDYTLSFAGAGNFGMDITGHNCVIVDVSDPVDTQGLLQATVTFQHLADNTDSGLQIDVINDESDNRTQP